MSLLRYTSTSQTLRGGLRCYHQLPETKVNRFRSVTEYVGMAAQRSYIQNVHLQVTFRRRSVAPAHIRLGQRFGRNNHNCKALWFDQDDYESEEGTFDPDEYQSLEDAASAPRLASQGPAAISPPTASYTNSDDNSKGDARQQFISTSQATVSHLLSIPSTYIRQCIHFKLI